MRLWIAFLVPLTLSLFGQNQATQFASFVVTLDASSNITISAYQETTYSSYSSSAAYILIPTKSVTANLKGLATTATVDLPFKIQVLPIQTSAENFQLQATVLPQRYNFLGFVGAYYYYPQFYLLQQQGGGNIQYVYGNFSIDSIPLVVWNQGQTTIGTGTALAAQTVSLLLAPSYDTPNLLANATGTKALTTLDMTLSIPVAAALSAVPTNSGQTVSYFFQVYLTLNPYQTMSQSTLSTFLTSTLGFLDVLAQQSTQYEATNNSTAVAAQLAVNQAFLIKEQNAVQAFINNLN